jgi:hypothetical protein
MTPIQNLNAEELSTEILSSIVLDELTTFLANYPENILKLMAMADTFADSSFSDSPFPGNVRVSIPSLEIDLNFPMILRVNTVWDHLIISSIFRKFVQATARMKDQMENSNV